MQPELGAFDTGPLRAGLTHSKGSIPGASGSDWRQVRLRRIGSLSFDPHSWRSSACRRGVPPRDGRRSGRTRLGMLSTGSCPRATLPSSWSEAKGRWQSSPTRSYGLHPSHPNGDGACFRLTLHRHWRGLRAHAPSSARPRANSSGGDSLSSLGPNSMLRYEHWRRVRLHSPLSK